MFTSEAVTRRVRIAVVAEYAPQRSRPAQNQWFFLYTITITNEGEDVVQLLSRHWVITDGAGHIEEVRGPGVVGEEPVLTPGESFEYTSWTRLATAHGTMRGSFFCMTDDAQPFDAPIGEFGLTLVSALH